MKILTLALLVLLFIIGCSERDEQGRYLYSANSSSFRYIMVDGHEYLQWSGGGGIAHSPKCPCKKSKEETQK